MDDDRERNFMTIRIDQPKPISTWEEAEKQDERRD